ncbi:hypothetical protein JOE48_001226 [Methylobacterium sp. PvR107]|nr:hypothetical protein [Methylobacterium sp. PvR107]
MIRFAIALVFLATPALAAPARRQPTPATVQQGSDPANPASTDGMAEAAEKEQARGTMQKELDARQKAMDARTKRTIGSICRGC